MASVGTYSPRASAKAEPTISNGHSVVIRVRQRLPDFLLTVNLKYVKLGYHYVMSHALYLLMLPLLLVVVMEFGRVGQGNVVQLWTQLQFNLVSVLACSGALVFVGTVYFVTKPRPIYLVDFACYKPEDDRKTSMQKFLQRTVQSGQFNEQSVEFQRKIIERSGLGQDTYLPRGVIDLPPNPCMKEARLEAEMVMFGALNELFEKTGVKPKDIGILIVNCSLFNPTPSLSAMIVNHYHMRGNIQSINIGGMGCSAGVIAIDLAKDLLQVHGGSYAIVLSTENITLNWYFGNDRSKLVSNCIFRMGGAAMLLSNKRSEGRRAKYELQHSVRTHKGADEKSFRCVFQEEDTHGSTGVSLARDLMRVAGDALKSNITTLGPLVLPYSEQLLFFINLVATKILSIIGSEHKLKPYIPDFKLAFDHFCIHAGGRAVLDEVEKNLQLSEYSMEPSRMTLFRFGNTSSSSPWYELAYLESKGRVRRGDRVWQISFGSGFKCNSAVWRALRTVKPNNRYSPWSDCIDKFPVKVPTSATISD